MRTWTHTHKLADLGFIGFKMLLLTLPFGLLDCDRIIVCFHRVVSLPLYYLPGSCSYTRKMIPIKLCL